MLKTITTTKTAGKTAETKLPVAETPQKVKRTKTAVTKPTSEIKDKEYANRIDAEVFLSSQGIAKRDFHRLAKKGADGKVYIINIDKVAEFKANRAKLEKGESVSPTYKPIGAYQEGSCSQVARSLILAGKTNAEVWEVIQKKFNLDDKKKGYPAWYRMDLKRRGMYPVATK